MLIGISPGEPRKVDLQYDAPADRSGTILARPYHFTVWKALIQ